MYDTHNIHKPYCRPSQILNSHAKILSYIFNLENEQLCWIKPCIVIYETCLMCVHLSLAQNRQMRTLCEQVARQNKYFHHILVTEFCTAWNKGKNPKWCGVPTGQYCKSIYFTNSCLHQNKMFEGKEDASMRKIWVFWQEQKMVASQKGQ